MRHLVLLLVLLVLGCDTAGPGFGGLPARSVEVEGTRFDLRLREDGIFLPLFEPAEERGA